MSDIGEEKARLYQDAQHISDFTVRIGEIEVDPFRVTLIRPILEETERCHSRSEMLANLLSTISCHNATDFGLHGEHEQLRAQIGDTFDALQPTSQQIVHHLRAALDLVNKIEEEHGQFSRLFFAESRGLMQHMRNLREQADNL